MARPTLAIIGSGYTGDRLAASQAQQGHRVVLVSRTPTRLKGVEALAADLDQTDQSTLGATLPTEPFDLVYLPPPSAEPGELDARLTHVLRALRVAPRRVVLASTSGVYGNRHGADTDESAPLNPESERAKRRVRLEQTLAALAESSTTTVILRIAGIYGPGRLPLDALRRGDPIIDPAEANPGNRIHVDDLVRCIEKALAHNAPPDVVNVADGDYTTSPDFTLAVADIAGLPIPPTISLAQAKAEFSPMRWSFIRESRQLNVQRLIHDLGVELQYANHRDGIRASLAVEAD